ncbi:MAG: hypothetical protein IKT40_01290 [Bacilli bacterium]|nr:hypothetical protein [Bacilli bacterium]
MKKIILKYLQFVIVVALAVTLITISFDLISAPNTMLNVVGVILLLFISCFILYFHSIKYQNKQFEKDYQEAIRRKEN